jgi:hypothetical protein
MSGTIDIEGFRADLKAISQNDYPRLTLLKLPFNWLVPGAGPGQPQMRGFTPVANYNGVTPIVVPFPAGSAIGDFAVVMFGTGTGPAGWDATIPAGWSLVYGGPGVNLQKANPVITKVLTAGDISAGGVSVAVNPASRNDVAAVVMIGATGGVREVDVINTNAPSIPATNPETVSTSADVVTSDFMILFGSSWANVSPGVVQVNTGVQLSQDQSGIQAGVLGYQLPAGDGIQNATFEWVGNQPGNGQSVSIIVIQQANPDLAGFPAPVNSVPLAGPMNFLALVSEAIDEQGVYWQSAQVGQGIAAGWLRFNGTNNAWIPMAFGDPMMRGFQQAADNYSGTPIAGMGFQAIEQAFGRLDWQPATPVFYGSGAPPAPEYVLAFAGLSVGLGAGIGNGAGDTYAIPTAAGPIKREKDACLL